MKRLAAQWWAAARRTGNTTRTFGTSGKADEATNKRWRRVGLQTKIDDGHSQLSGAGGSVVTSHDPTTNSKSLSRRLLDGFDGLNRLDIGSIGSIGSKGSMGSIGSIGSIGRGPDGLMESSSLKVSKGLVANAAPGRCCHPLVLSFRGVHSSSS